ncbi:MAG: hypothetical protein R2693_05135 [Nocardioidaceae bacterium]
MANEGERNIGDRAVEHDHQLSDADQHQSPAKVLPRLLASLRFRRCADVVVRAHEAPGAGVDWSDWLTCNRAMAEDIPHSSAWFRVGQIDVTTTVLVTAIAVISMVVNAIVPMLVLRLLFAGDATLLPVRALASLKPIRSDHSPCRLFFFWYFGSRWRPSAGPEMLRYLGWAWLVHTVLAFAFGLVSTVSLS